MAKVTLVQMVYNGMKYIPQSFGSMVNQTYKDLEIVAVINGNADGGKEYIQTHYPQVRIIDTGENLKFVRGHNLVFSTIETEFFQLVNQDLILELDYVEKIVKAFDNSNVGAANGKIYQYDFETHTASKVLDTTGIMCSRNGRGKSRGQNEEDAGQYDTQYDVVGVDGAACMYRRSALEAVKMPLLGKREEGRGKSGGAEPQALTSHLSPLTYEYFDIDFDMYWEDVDLSLRISNAGFACKYVPDAVGYHGRTAAASKKGYKDVNEFVKHHKKFPAWIKQFNYKNHIFVVVKNFPKFYWKFFVREFFMLGYIVLFETATLKIVPTLLRQLPRMWKKRRWIQQHRKSTSWVSLLGNKGLLN